MSEDICHLRAVHVEPPVADEVLLVEQGAVGAEEAVLEQRAAAVRSADVESLTVGISVRIVPWRERENRDQGLKYQGVSHLLSVHCNQIVSQGATRIWGSPLRALQGYFGLKIECFVLRSFVDSCDLSKLSYDKHFCNRLRVCIWMGDAHRGSE